MVSNGIIDMCQVAYLCLTLTAVHLFWYLYENNKIDVILQADD